MAENQEFGPKIYFSPDNPTGGPDQGEAGRPGQEYFSRIREEEYAMTDPGHEALKLTDRPEVVIKVAGDALEDFEDLDKKDRSITNWTLTRYYEQIAARRRALRLTRGELVEIGIAEGELDQNGAPRKDNQGQVIIKKSLIPGYALKTGEGKPETRPETVTRRKWPLISVPGATKPEDRFKRDESKGEEWEEIVEVRERRETTEFGLDTERQKMVRAYDRAEQMMIVRQDLMTLYSDYYLPNTASLENLVTLYHIGHGVPKLSATELKTLFTLPDFREVGGNPEDRTLGNYIDLADRLFEIAAVSEFQGRFKELMARPGWKIVFEGMSEKEIEDWIGHVENWVPDDQRHQDSINVDPAKLPEKAPGGKTDKGERGLLTEFGNTWARMGKNDEALLLNRIELFIAKDYMKKHPKVDKNVALQIAKTAVRLAHYFNKISGFFAYLGKERYPKIVVDKHLEDAPVFPTDPQKLKDLLNDPEGLKKFQKALLLEGDPKTDDLTKLYHFREYRIKEFTKAITTGGRSAGPGVTISGSEERLSLPLMLLARSKTSQGLRSFHEQKWGYIAKGTPGKPGYMPEEPAKRLGELEWDLTLSISELQQGLGVGVKLEAKDIEEMLKSTTRLINAKTGRGPDDTSADTEGLAPLNIWNLYTLFDWLAGRDDEIKGLYKFFYAEDFDTRLFGNDLFWKGKSKFLGIVINGLLMSDGQYRRFYEDIKAQHPEYGIDRLNEEVMKELTKKAGEAADRDRKLFVHGMANLPNTGVWRAQKVEVRVDTPTGTMIEKWPLWKQARLTAARCGFPFSEEQPEQSKE